MENNKLDKSYKLTKHKLGSILEIFTISYPLMLGLFASTMMVFVDRIMLSRFSLDSMNAATLGGTGVFSILILPLVIASITEVFVGQYHGHKTPEKMGMYVWQMVWFSIFLFPIFYIIKITYPYLIFKDNEMAINYFQIMIQYGTFFCLPLALTGFFAGRGKVKTIAIISIISNILNCFLDYLLIFGIGIFPMMGIKGAAYATAIAQVTSTIIFFFLFLRKKNIKENGALKWKLKFEYFYKCLKIGFPASFAHFSEFTSHLVFFLLMSKLGKEYITISSLLQTVYIFSYFVIEGLSKGVTAICSNFIGAGKYDLIKKNLRSATILQSIFGFIIILVFVNFSPKIFLPFFNNDQIYIFNDPNFSKLIYSSSIYLALFWLIDGYNWIITGLLIAAGDTKFIMKIGVIAPWLIDLLPMYLFIKYLNVSIDVLWLWIVIYGLIILLIYFLRYKSNRWKKIAIIENSNTKENIT